MVNGIVMWISFLFLWSWVPAHWKRRMVGYGFLTDITVHIVLQSLFGGDAGGRVAMLFAGVLINISLHTYRKFFGFEKLTSEGWITYK